MTPGEIITISLSRAGIHNPSDAQKDRAREYINVVSNDIENLTEWVFLFRTSTLSTTASTRGYELASDVLYPIKFWDSTNDNTIDMRHPDDIIDLDPDEDNTGDPRIAVVTGIDTSSGVWEVDLYPTPDATSDTIKYRYYATISDLSSSDDSTELGAKYPKWLQNALLYGATALAKEERSNDTAASEWEKHNAAVQSGLRINNKIRTGQRYQLGAGRESFTIVPDVTADS